jgi:colicin import membrane protein
MDARLDYPVIEPGAMRAGALALLVHLAFFGLLLFGLSWQKQEPEAVMADLWSNLPAPTRSAPPPPPPPPTREAAPEPVKPQPKAEPKPEPRVEPAKPDIALKAQKEDKKKEIKRPEPKPATKPVEEPKKKPVVETKPSVDREALLQKQLEMFAKQDTATPGPVQTQEPRLSAAQQSVIGEYKGRIKLKIRGYLNARVCGNGNPQLEFEIALFPSGQLRGSPLLRKSSGIAACDRAVESAILQSDPLPVPPQPEIFNEFRNLRLVFRPNDPND